MESLPRAIRLLFVFFLACLLAGACTQSERGFLDQFPKEQPLLHPIDSIDLESMGIITAGGKLSCYEGSFVVQLKGSQRYAICLFNPQAERKIDCFLKGRGPEEVIAAGNHCIQGDTLWVVDAQRGRILGMDLKETLRLGEQQVCASLDFGNLLPVKAIHAARSWIAVGMSEPYCWYKLLRSPAGGKSSVPFFCPDEWEGFSDMELLAIHLNSQLALSPDGKKVVGILPPGVISLSNLDDSQKVLEEYYRKAYSVPSVSPTRKEGMPAMRHDAEQERGIIDISAREESFFLLYSNRSLKSEVPSYEGGFLAEMDWDGAPRMLYRLSRPICSIFVEGNKVYGLTTAPATRIIVYDFHSEQKSSRN